jgi:hypothetical protein
MGSITERIESYQKKVQSLSMGLKRQDRFKKLKEVCDKKGRDALNETKYRWRRA